MLVVTIVLSRIFYFLFCRDKTFVTTNIWRDKHNFVATTVLLRQAYFCRDKTRLLSRQTGVCREKHVFVATKRIFVVVPANDKHVFVATKRIFVVVPANDKHAFVATKRIFEAAPTSNSLEP